MPTIDTATSWQTWLNAASSPAIDAAVRDLYQRVDDAVAARGPTCWISGRCCNFDAYGHRMYVTGLEIAWVIKETTNSASHLATPLAATNQPRANTIDLRAPCIFQRNNLCSIHTIRPLGCRLFFCQQGTQDWQHDLYESFQRELRLLHDHHALPYQYMEWRAGLKECLEHIADE